MKTNPGGSILTMAVALGRLVEGRAITSLARKIPPQFFAPTPPKHPGHPRRSFIWLLLVGLVAMLLVPPIKAAPRVALMDFSAADNSYRSATAAADFSGLLQARLMTVGGVEWVERSQLQSAENELSLSAGSHVSPTSALKLGKLVKADLMIAGQFVSGPTLARQLQIDIIDLEHADVLAELSLAMGGATNHPVEVLAGEVAVAAEKLQAALRQAQERLAQIRNQPIIAPLFFANISASRRLDAFESQLQTALSEAASAQKIRLLQFPRAAQAAGEAGLVMAGLVEQDPGAWQKVADIYVWGQYEEVKPAEFAYVDTPVKFTLNVWNGGGEVQTVVETAKVSELPQLKDRLVQRIWAATRTQKAPPASETTRFQVARQLLLRADEIQVLFTPETLESPALLATAPGRQLWCYQNRLLATAHFFAPESHLIHRLWLESLWSQPQGLPGEWFERIRSYQDFDDKFGLISPAESGADAQLSGQPGQWHWFERAGSYDSILVQEWMNLLNAMNPPEDIPTNVLAAWTTQAKEDFALRLYKLYETATHANPPILLFNPPMPLVNPNQIWPYAFALKDKELRLKFVEEMWPFYLDSFSMCIGRHVYTADEYNYYFRRALFPQLRQFFSEAGHPEIAETYIAQFKQKVTVGDPTAAEEQFDKTSRRQLVGVDLLPPKLSPELKPVVFPEAATVSGVLALKFDHGMLWASTRGGGLGLDDPEWEYLLADHTNAALWRIPANAGAPEPIPVPMGRHSKITSFCVQGSNLWMTLQQDGVFCLNPATLQPIRYGDQQGVLSRQMFASALFGNELYFGGGEPNSGKLNRVDPAGQSWKSQDLGGGGQIKLLEPFGRHLVLGKQILDLDTGGKHSVRDLFSEVITEPDPPMSNRGFEVLAATSDTNALWLGTKLGLVAYNPDTGAMRKWLSLSKGYLVDVSGKAEDAVSPVRLPGAVTALASDGDFLWVATTTRFDPLNSGNGGEGRWVNGYYIFTIELGGFGSCSQYGGWQNMHAKNECDYVMLLHKPTGKWLGYFPVTSRVTSLAVGDGKLWIGLEKTGYLRYAEHSWADAEVFAASPLIEVQTPPLFSPPASQWVSNEVSTAELNPRIQDAAQALKLRLTPPPTAIHTIAEQRDAFLQQNFSKFIPVQFQRGSNGFAALQHLPVRENRFAYNGTYFCGVRFTLPAWFDGDLHWMYTLDKTARNKDFSAQTSLSILPESGHMDAICDYHAEELESHPQLQRQLPNSHSVVILEWDMDRFIAGKTYAAWFAPLEEDHPDIVFSITINSAHGTNEFGPLPLR